MKEIRENSVSTSADMLLRFSDLLSSVMKERLKAFSCDMSKGVSGLSPFMMKQFKQSETHRG